MPAAAPPLAAPGWPPAPATTLRREAAICDTSSAELLGQLCDQSCQRVYARVARITALTGSRRLVSALSRRAERALARLWEGAQGDGRLAAMVQPLAQFCALLGAFFAAHPEPDLAPPSGLRLRLVGHLRQVARAQASLPLPLGCAGLDWGRLAGPAAGRSSLAAPAGR